MIFLKNILLVFLFLFISNCFCWAKTYEIVSDYSFNRSSLYIYKVVDNGKYGIVSDSGKIIIPVEYDSIEKDKYLIAKKNNKIEIFFPDGSKVLSGEYDNIKIRNNIIFLKSGNRTKIYKDEKLIDFPANEVYPFNENFVFFENNDKLGLYSIYDEKTLIPAYYDDLHFLRNDSNNFIIAKKNTRYGLFKNNGEVVFSVVYKTIEFLDMFILFKKENDKYDIYLKNNLEKIFSNEEDIHRFIRNSNDVYTFIIKRKNKYGIINFNNLTRAKNEILPFEYDEIKFVLYNNYCAKLGEKYFIFEISETEANPKFIFDKMKKLNNRYYEVEIDGKNLVYAQESNKIIDYNTYKRYLKSSKIGPIGCVLICSCFGIINVVIKTGEVYTKIKSKFNSKQNNQYRTIEVIE